MALRDSGVQPSQIDLINGHLTATAKDVDEVQNWVTALGLPKANFPWIQATKSLVGHCLSASGAIESIATVIQLDQGKIHPSVNCEDLHPEIAGLIGKNRIPTQTVNQEIQVAIKASFGFGDVNSCIIFKKYKP